MALRTVTETVSQPVSASSLTGRRHTGELVVVSLLINILGLALPLTMLQVYDRILPNTNTATLSLLVLAVGVAIVLEVALRQLRDSTVANIAARFEHRGHSKTLARLMRMPMADYARQGGGSLLERLSAIDQLRDQVSGRSHLALIDFPFVFLYLGMFWFLAGPLVLVPLGLSLVYAVLTLVQAWLLRDRVEANSVQDERRYNFMLETLAGIHTVKAMAAEAQMQRRFERLLENAVDGRRMVSVRSASVQISGALFSQLTTVLTVAGGALLVIDHTMTIGGMAACTMLAGRVSPAVQAAFGVWVRHQTLRVARQRVADTFAIPQSHVGVKLPPVDGPARLELQQVRFGKRRSGEPLLGGVDLTLEPGDSISIRGDNGCGKTVLLWLMAGQFSPDEGRVLVDGVDLASVDRFHLHNHIGYLPDHGELVQGTFLENLTMFDRERERAAMQVADELGLGDIAAYLPQGYDTKLGGRIADILPRGVVQRIALARVLALRPRLILFDDANTLLDGSAETLLMEAIRRRKAESTLVVVSHRPSTLRAAERHFLLENGRLSESPLPVPAAAPPAKPQAPA
jgi:ATP-binding cassette subfamily C protein LapB